MYTESDRDSTLRKRGFKFVNKSGKRAITTTAFAAKAKVETNEIELIQFIVRRADFHWPDELMQTFPYVGYAFDELNRVQIRYNCQN